MPELDNQLPEQGRQPSVGTEGSSSLRTVVALQSLALVEGSYSSYRMAIARNIAFDSKGNLVSSEIYKLVDAVQSFEAFQMLLVLWKESRFSSPEDLKRAGIPPKKCHTGLTRRALGELLSNSDELRRAMIEQRQSPQMTEMFLRRAERLIDIFLHFRLVEEYVEPPLVPRANWKPLRATEKLHQLMCTAGIACAHFRHAADNAQGDVPDGIAETLQI